AILLSRTAARCRRPVHSAPSATNAETLDQTLVARLVVLLDVVEQRTALRHHLEKTATRMVVLHVGLEMIGQVGDALGEDRNLHFRRTGVAGLQRIVFNERGLALGSDRHRSVLLAGGGKSPSQVRVGRAGMSSRSVAW